MVRRRIGEPDIAVPAAEGTLEDPGEGGSGGLVDVDYSDH
jgi:hypothetical protein